MTSYLLIVLLVLLFAFAVKLLLKQRVRTAEWRTKYWDLHAAHVRMAKELDVPATIEPAV